MESIRISVTRLFVGCVLVLGGLFMFATVPSVYTFFDGNLFETAKPQINSLQTQGGGYDG